MGTPDFAVPSLVRLHEDGHEICGVFTRPDKPKGRGMKLTPTPVKEKALSLGIPVYQPAGFKNGQALEVLRQLAPEIIIVVAYGCLLPEGVLTLPKYGCINVHASLLPKYRGAAPIQWSVINGERETGVTIMHMSCGLDEGDIIFSEAVRIEADDTGGTVHDKLMACGASLLSETLTHILRADAPRIAQDGRLSCYAPRIQKNDACIDWNASASDICNLIRGMDPWPAAYTLLNGQQYKLFAPRLLDGRCEFPAGTLLTADAAQGLTVCCGDGGVILISQLQAQGGRRMQAGEYLRGHALKAGSRFDGSKNPG